MSDEKTPKEADSADDAMRFKSPWRPLDWLTNPITMISLALLAVALWATPYYLKTMEQELFDGEVLISICSGFARASSNRAPRRPALF